MKFTKEALAALALPLGKTDHFEWDDELPSFGVRLRTRGKRWVVQYRVGTPAASRELGRRAQGQARGCPQDRAATVRAG